MLLIKKSTHMHVQRHMSTYIDRQRCIPSLNACSLSFFRVLYNGKNCVWFSLLVFCHYHRIYRKINISQNLQQVYIFAHFLQIHRHAHRCIHLLHLSFLTDSLAINPSPLLFSVPHSLVLSSVSVQSLSSKADVQVY